MDNRVKHPFLSLLLPAFIVISCGDPVGDNTYEEYIGYWESSETNTYIDIVNSGISSYEKISAGSTTSSSGRARIKGDERKLKVGIKGFKIDEPPKTVIDSSDGSRTTYKVMILEGEKFVDY